MSFRRWTRFFVRLAFYTALAVLCLLLTSRWWLPAVLPAALGHWGVTVDSVERTVDGDLRFAGLAVDQESAKVRIDFVQLPGEFTYLWERFLGEWTDASLIEIGKVAVQLLEAELAPSEPPAPPVYAPELYGLVESALQSVDIWVPTVHVEAVNVLRGTESVVSVQAVSFRGRKLEGMFSAAPLSGGFEVEAQLEPDAPWLIEWTHADSGVSANLTIDGLDEAVRIEGTIRQLESQLELSAVFGSAQWLPLNASVASDLFLIDPAWLPAAGGLDLEALRLTDVDLSWKEGAYAGTLRAQVGVVTRAGRQANPATGTVQARARGVVTGTAETVPLTADIALSGDLETLRLETCELVADWGQLSLSEPVTIRLQDGSVEQSAVLRAVLDLSKQAFVEVSGQVEARLTVAPSFQGGPDLRFELSAKDLGYQSYQVDRVELSGRLQGDALSIDRMAILPLAGADEQVIELSGKANLASRELMLDYNLLLSADWVNRQVGQSIFSESLNTNGRISGTFERPIVDGKVEPLTLEAPELVPVTLAGNYRSEGVDRFSFDGSATAQGAVINTSLDATLGDEMVTVNLKRLIWSDPERPRLELMAPTQLSYQFSGSADAPENRLLVTPFDLTGPDLQIQGQWDPAVGLELLLRNVSLQRVGRWLERELPEFSIKSVAVSFSELRPKLIGSIGVHLESEAADGVESVHLDLVAQLTATGVTVDPLQLKYAHAPLLQGAISVPMTFRIPAEDKSFWNLLDAGALSGELTGAINPAFSDWLLQNTGVKVEEAMVDLNLKGSLEKPIGLLDLRVASLETSIVGVPAIDRIELVAKGAPEQIEIERFNFLVNRSKVSGALSLPLDGFVDALQGDLDQRKAWLAKGAGRIELVDWLAEDWVDYLPAMIRRSGRLTGSLELKPNWDLSGSLSFEEFALRPTQSLPSVDLIGGRIELLNRKLTVDEASAQVGGSPVTVAGWLDASDLENPLWEFTVEGTNVPLVSTTDMILRSDLDVKASHTNRSETPLIRGALNLRSSTMLVEFDPLAPNVETGPQSQPPFFSITEPAIADWRFDLKVSGDSFMRVRSPYFKTQLTANFDLGGTFAEPLLIGSVRTVEGELRFPGAKMRIASGEAFIEPAQPNAVQLNFSGIAQKTSYIITMDVSQTLADPLIQFQSTPALSNAAIVRLLTTGSTTGGGVGTVGLYLGQGLLGAGGMDETLADRLTVDVGEETSRSGRNTVGVRFDLSEDFFLEGGYDVYDAYNMDLIWSIFKR